MVDTEALAAPRFFPKVMAGEALVCQFFSEPAAGADLAAARTRDDRITLVGRAGGCGAREIETYRDGEETGELPGRLLSGRQVVVA